MFGLSSVDKLPRATIDELVRSDRPDLTSPGGQDVNSIGSSRVQTKIVTINGTKYYETVSITDTKPDTIMEMLVKEGGTNGFWGACYGTSRNKIFSNGSSISHLFDSARLMEGEHKAVGAVYSRSYHEAFRISRTHSFVVTGITNRSIRLAATLSDGVVFRPIGILVEDAMQGDGAVVRIRRPVDKIGSAFGCCGVSYREKMLLRMIDNCDRDPLIAIANQGANMQMALMNSGGMQASMMQGMNPAALNAMMQAQGGMNAAALNAMMQGQTGGMNAAALNAMMQGQTGGMNAAALNAMMQAQMGGANTQISGNDTLPMGVKADDEKTMDIPVAEATDLEKGGFE